MEKVVIEHESRKKYWPRAVVAGDRAYFSSAAVGDDGNSVGPSFEEQLDYILGEVRETLESLGSSMDQIVEMTLFYVNMKRDLPKVVSAAADPIGKIDNAEVSLGQTLNMKFHPSIFEKPDGFKKLADLIRVFVDQKLDEVQINVVSADMLKAAQKEPDKHKDLW